MKNIVFFNNKGGVGKTTLVYHIAYMFAELGCKSLAVDLDPQLNLTSMFLKDRELLEIYENEQSRPTILESIQPLIRGLGDIQPVKIKKIGSKIGLLPGDLNLSMFEDKLSSSWGNCLNRDEAAFRIVSSFYRIMKEAGERFGADVNLIDVGPNLGAINRATLIAADYVVVPMAADLFSLIGLGNLGDRLAKWKIEWEDRIQRNPDPAGLDLPYGRMSPIGYVIMQHGIKQKKPVKAYLAWANRIPQIYRESVLGKNPTFPKIEVAEDDNCLALLKNYHSLAPMSMEAKKPIFLLKPADGAIGAHMGGVRKSYQDFERLTQKIIARIGLE